MTERRTIAIHELRADPQSRQITGIAAPYGVLSADLGGFREQIDPNAFTRSLAERLNILAYYNHDSSLVLGSVALPGIRSRWPLLSTRSSRHQLRARPDHADGARRCVADEFWIHHQKANLGRARAGRKRPGPNPPRC